ncbi:MAG: putative molybdenum carrier protein [Verrucomicrobia subdivision 3 bacterium]|nr:putative molybdenum carrier protein [Limisphaerales bacterium]
MTIIAGGQTGVDRAALDFAIQYGIEHGGWCPAGRWAEDATIPMQYRLRETESGDPAERTEQNVIDSDATVIIARERSLSGGTRLTEKCCEGHNKPLLVLLESDGVAEAARQLRTFVSENAVMVLNVAGPRESEAPGLGAFVHRVLGQAFSGKDSEI